MLKKPARNMILILIILLLLFIARHLTPSGAIRFYIAVHGDPLAAINVSIHQGGFFKRSWAAQAYGWQFSVDGYYLCFFYLSRDSLGLWRVTSAGTGP
ncbi:MAG: hypothetical protein M0Z41_20555 [Peptococcaceae bacterium]|jgi:hypothetical protein|nr:hypothetical protein [Peptococcaceae bacterium]